MNSLFVNFDVVYFLYILWILLKILYLPRVSEVDIYHEICLVYGFLCYKFRTVALCYIFLLDSDQ